VVRERWQRKHGPEQLIEGGLSDPYALYVVDLDADGDLDVTVTSFFEQKAFWYANDGSGGFGSQQLVADEFSSIQSVYPGDFDGDGDPDLVVSAGAFSKVAWYSNDGSGGFGAQQPLSLSYLIWACDVRAADIDGDSDIDIFVANKLGRLSHAWFENDGTGAFSAAIPISTWVATSREIDAADLDGDGDLDIVTSGSSGGEFAWERNPGTNPWVSDTDGDGLDDGDEVHVHGSDPNLIDTDGDGLEDGDEVNIHGTDPSSIDTDQDGLSDPDEVANLYGTSALNPDTDADGLLDGDEVLVLGTDPTNEDSDGDLILDADEDSDDDGLSNALELYTWETDPLDPDTDGDGLSDGDEIVAGTDPLDPNDPGPDPVPGSATFIGLGDLAGGGNHSIAFSVSGDGSTVVGFSVSASGIEAFRWTSDGGMVGLGDLPGGNFSSNARGVSADGSVIVGGSYDALGLAPFGWTSGGGMIKLGVAGLSAGSSAIAVSDDGETVVGWGEFPPQSPWSYWICCVGLRWTGDLGSLGAWVAEEIVPSFATDVSADGSMIVGVGTTDYTCGGSDYCGEEAFRWTSGGGLEGLGDFPGGFPSSASAVSGDGSTIVGSSEEVHDDVFIWDAGNGMRLLSQVLTAQGADLTGWELREATDVSNDGLVIVGWGVNPSGEAEAWHAVLGALLSVPLMGPIGAILLCAVLGSVGLRELHG
jgi:uncharacterized membrane protein